MMTLEEAIADCEEEISDCQIDLDGIMKLVEKYPERKTALAHDIDSLKKHKDYKHQLAEWLKELAERRKVDNEIPFGNNAPFSELDSIINAYEVHGGYHKKVVELLKELRERRKQPEIIRCKDCENWDTTWQNDSAPNYHYCPMMDGSYSGDFYCGKAERRTDEQVQRL